MGIPIKKENVILSRKQAAKICVEQFKSSGRFLLAQGSKLPSAPSASLLPPFLPPFFSPRFRDFCFALFEGGPFIDDIDLGRNAKRLTTAVETMGVLPTGRAPGGRPHRVADPLSDRPPWGWRRPPHLGTPKLPYPPGMGVAGPGPGQGRRPPLRREARPLLHAHVQGADLWPTTLEPSSSCALGCQPTRAFGRSPAALALEKEARKDWSQIHLFLFPPFLCPVFCSFCRHHCIRAARSSPIIVCPRPLGPFKDLQVGKKAGNKIGRAHV